MKTPKYETGALLCLTPKTINSFISNDMQKSIVAGVMKYLLTQEPGACYWAVTEDIGLTHRPPRFKGCKRFRAIVPTNYHSKEKIEIFACFVFCPDQINTKQAIYTAQNAMPMPVTPLS